MVKMNVFSNTQKINLEKCKKNTIQPFPDKEEFTSTCVVLLQNNVFSYTVLKLGQLAVLYK